MADFKIIVKKDTLDRLKGLKVSFKLTSYDDVINELIRSAYSNEKTEKISNEELLINLNKNFKKNLQRIEAMHTRIGYFEKDYFIKIQDIFDYIDSGSKVVNVKSEEKNLDNSSFVQEEKKYRLRIENLEESHLELESANEDLIRKLNFIREKIVKKSGVFASGYEMHITEEEYNNLVV